ncbi:hypothetical protein RI129_011856 [Pyrocoelia pectoralis]|uniref:Uncharacterized protein n=1 Tax=Pyrocoelia pectoralis TaxID=417401 RepID=A0AAN7V9L6_9COLE
MWKIVESQGVLVFAFISVTFMENVYTNQSAELISTYSKVSRWGANSSFTNPNEPRSSGHNWMSNSEKSSRRRQKPSPTYYYGIKSSTSKLDKDKDTDVAPARGEVQDRFNPVPYFDFVYKDPPRVNRPRPIKTKDKETSQTNYNYPTIVYGAPSDLSPPQDQPPSDSYSSPFTSYNPSQPQLNDLNNTSDMLQFPPNDDQPPLTTLTTNKRPLPPATSYGIPKKDPQNAYLPPDTATGNIPDNFHPPLLSNTPPNNPDESYFKPSDTGDLSPTGGQPQDYYNAMKPSPLRRPHHQPNSMSSIQMADDELSPPPPHPKFPEYLDHDPYDFHHDVYHEVHATTTPASTTTEAPRAGSGHYSYYYLGRKLWYIPLYFSVYFIVYVTVLILKSIARHKIQLSHHFDKGRSSRELDVLNQTVITALEESSNKYM